MYNNKCIIQLTVRTIFKIMISLVCINITINNLISGLRQYHVNSNMFQLRV